MTAESFNLFMAIIGVLTLVFTVLLSMLAIIFTLHKS